MDMLDICIKQGYVPPDCKLDGAIAFMIVRDVVDIVPITIHIVSRVILHLARHMAHQFQKGISAGSAEERFTADIIIARIAHERKDF